MSDQQNLGKGGQQDSRGGRAAPADTGGSSRPLADRPESLDADSGQVGAIAMALAVAGAVALFAPGGLGAGAQLSGGLTGAASGEAAEPGSSHVEPVADAETVDSRSSEGGSAASSDSSASPSARTSETTSTVPVTVTPSVDSTRAVGDERSPLATPMASDTPEATEELEEVGDPLSASAALEEMGAPLPTPAAPDLPVGLTAEIVPYFALGRPFGTELENRASRYYPYGTTGHGEYLLHHGVDIGNPQGTPVLAIADGTVVFAGSDEELAWGPQTDFYGQLVIVRHDALEAEGAPLHTLYGHLSSVFARAGDEIAGGDEIGAVGMTGVALGPHLHLEVRLTADDYETTRNPELFLAPREGVGTIVGRLRDSQNRPLPGRSVTLYEAVGESAGTWLGETTTYPGRGVKTAYGWNENFVFGDVAPGTYVLSVEVDDGSATVPVNVTAGAATIAALTTPGKAPR